MIYHIIFNGMELFINLIIRIVKIIMITLTNQSINYFKKILQ